MVITIFKRGRIWWVSASSGGRQERWSLKTTDRKIAAQMAKGYEERFAAGTRLRQPRADSPTFAEFSEAWLTRKTLSRRKSTVLGYKHAVAEVAKVIGTMPIIEVTRTHAREITEALAKGGKGARGRVTVLRNLSYIQALFSDAAEHLRDAEGRLRILENPFANKAKLVEDLMDSVESGIQDPEVAPQPYTAEELAALERAAEADERFDASDRLKVLWGLDAGLRRSEVFGLHRADLDLEQQWTWVRRRISRAEVGAPKTKRSRRRVPLTDRLVAATRQHVLDSGLANVALFPPRKRGGHLPYEDADRFNDRFLRVMKAAQVEGREHPFHRLRHTWVSRLLGSGVEPYLVSKWAGHRSTAFTEEHYAEWIPGDSHRERVNRPQHGISTISAQSPPSSAKEDS